MSSTKDPLALLNKLDQYFKKVTESSKLFSKGMSKKQKNTVTGTLKRELLVIDREFKELYMILGNLQI